MIEQLIPRSEKPEDISKTEQKTQKESDATELDQLKAQLAEAQKTISELQVKQEIPEERKEPQPPNFPAAPTGGSQGTTDHRAKLLELYQRNPYQAAAYLQEHKSEIAQSAKELI